jgi:hypothetical protein
MITPLSSQFRLCLEARILTTSSLLMDAIYRSWKRTRNSILPPPTTTANRAHPARTDGRSAQLCRGGVGPTGRGEPGLSARARADDDASGVQLCRRWAGSGGGVGAPANIAELLTPAQRAKTAGELNAAILESMSQGKEAKLAGLIRLMAWGENLLENHGVEFPKMEFPVESEWEGDEGPSKVKSA